jgi:hypothetical protein
VHLVERHAIVNAVQPWRHVAPFPNVRNGYLARLGNLKLTLNHGEVDEVDGLEAGRGLIEVGAGLLRYHRGLRGFSSARGAAIDFSIQ